MHKYFAVWMVAVVAMAAMPARAQSLPAEESSAAPASRPSAMTPVGSAAWAKMKIPQGWLLPVQYGGRVMPLDSMARQVVWDVTGQRGYGKYDATALLLAWTWLWPQWANEPMVLVGSPDLQKHMGLPQDQKRFSYSALAGNSALKQLVMEARRPLQAKQRISALQRSAVEVWERVSILDTVQRGALLRVVPSIKDVRGEWVTVAEIGTQAGIDTESQQRIRGQWDGLRAAFLAGDSPKFNATAMELNLTLTGLKAAAWPIADNMALEILYNIARPFRAGWVMTFLAMAAGLLTLGWPNRWLKRIAWVLLLDGFAALTAGILVRWRVGGNIPVATMYESLVFMGWGVTAIGILMMVLVKHRVTLPVVAGIATAILVVADTVPLESNVSPLEPVLRNTAWLTYHVLTVMMAYSAFALAMGLGHVQAAGLALQPRGREWTASLGRLLYGVTLTGCVFLTAGIIFGAIWASRSWGRYWGWDPKETWSLITLLVYMVVLHGRRLGLFGIFGDAIGTILCFQLVIMTYYGVNFVLGQGLHSYGFASGGQIWVGLYVALEIGFVLWAWGMHGRNVGQPVGVGEKAVL